MTRFSRTAVLALAACLSSLLIASCATTSAGKGRAALPAAAYFPLAVGNSWTYAVTPAPKESAEDVVSIVDVDEKGAFIDSRGQRFTPRSDGIFDGARFLLQEPVEEGHAWMAIPSPSTVERFRVLAVDRVVSVPAGNFEDCVEVEGTQEVKNPETGDAATLVIAWTYAPNVGLVRIVSSTRQGREARVNATIELVRFTVKDAKAGKDPA